MPDVVRDTVNQVRHEFQPEGADLVNRCTVAPGGRLAAHGLANVSDRDARLSCLIQPARRLQSFLEEAATAGNDGMFTADGRPRGLRGARWAASFLTRYRDETVFLSPPPIVQRVLIALLARDS